jgi:Predicted membrane protein
MHLLYWTLIGFFAGVLAKALMPGSDREPKGCFMTIILGIAGSLLVGFLMRDVLGFQGTGRFGATLVGATIGAMILIFVMRKFWK